MQHSPAELHIDNDCTAGTSGCPDPCDVVVVTDLRAPEDNGSVIEVVRALARPNEPE